MSELSQLMEFLRSQPSTATIPLADKRNRYDRAERLYRPPEGVRVEPWIRDKLAGEWISTGDGAQPRVILYLHGGGYSIGSSRSHRHLAAKLAKETHSDALVLDYSLAPERPFPAALEDTVRAFDFLIADSPNRPVCVMGDSAGGGLTVAMLVYLRDRGSPLPIAGVCLSPWTDLTLAKEGSLATSQDPLVGLDEIRQLAGNYVGSGDPKNPLISPIFADLRDLPPLMVQASRVEALFSDAERLTDAAQVAGLDVSFSVAEDAPHVWHWFWPRLELARSSIREIAEWLEPRWGLDERVQDIES